VYRGTSLIRNRDFENGWVYGADVAAVDVLDEAIRGKVLGR